MNLYNVHGDLYVRLCLRHANLLILSRGDRYLLVEFLISFSGSGRLHRSRMREFVLGEARLMIEESDGGCDV